MTGASMTGASLTGQPQSPTGRLDQGRPHQAGEPFPSSILSKELLLEGSIHDRPDEQVTARPEGQAFRPAWISRQHAHGVGFKAGDGRRVQLELSGRQVIRFLPGEGGPHAAVAGHAHAGPRAGPRAGPPSFPAR